MHLQDRVIFVKPIKSYYRPELGDIVVGRVINVEASRWTVDINSYQHAILNLTSINLPGGVQRRKVEEDKLRMREHFSEGDLIVAEVSQVGSNDGRIMIQARNEKYGLLKNGVFLQVDNNHIRRMKNHMLKLFAEPEIGLIIGCNGYIWISAVRPKASSQSVSTQERSQIAVLRNAISLLDRAKLPIFRDTIVKVVEEQQFVDLQPSEMFANSDLML